MPTELPTTSPALLGALLLMAISGGMYLFRRLDRFHAEDKLEWQVERTELKEEIKRLNAIIDDMRRQLIDGKAGSDK